MPLIDGEEKTPEEAIAADRCPETGQPLKGLNIGDHIKRLWQGAIALGPTGEEPRKRIKMLKDWAKAHESDQPQYDEETGALLKK